MTRPAAMREPADEEAPMTGFRVMKTLALAEVQGDLPRLVLEVESRQDPITITRDGRPAAILVSVAEWESLRETIAVLGDPRTVADLEDAAESRAAGVVYSTDDVLTAFEAHWSQRI